MSGTITNGLSALLAAQRALQTTSNNIANANTAGYVRQRIDFVEQPGTPLGRITIGAGVAVADVSRIYDQFLTDNLRTSTSLEQRYVAYGDFATRLDTILGNPDTGVNASIQRFFDQVEAVGRDPTSIALRQQLLLEGDNLAARFQQLESRLNGLGNEIDARLENAASTINQLASQIADINDEILGTGSNAAPSLLDKRDELLRALGSQIDITTVRQDDGSVNVLVGSGQSLVLGNRAARLTTIPDPYDGSRLQLALDNGGNLQNISTKVNGGIVGGLLAFRNDVLDGARRDLGQLAVGLADLFNAQHRQGMDLNGDPGTDFFGTTTPLTSGVATNSVGATMTAAIDDTGSLAGRDYELRFNGSAWSVIDHRTGAVVPATGAGTVGSPLLFEGLSVSATAAAGDRFLVRPVANATTDFRVTLATPAEIAAAAPVAGGVAGSGDNSNILALALVAQQGLFLGGTQSIADLGAGIAATVGSIANRASNEIKVQEALREQAEVDVQNVSGVNLDEEAANMLRYQQAYLAASKVISVADGLFQNLLQIVGR